MGVFTRTGTVVNGRWVYKNSEDQYLYFPSGYMWMISDDYTSASAGVVDYSYSNALCPNDVGSNFQRWDGSEWGGSVAVVCYSWWQGGRGGRYNDYRRGRDDDDGDDSYDDRRRHRRDRDDDDGYSYD